MNKYWKDAIMGVVTGDALGCPVQFESREEVAQHPITGMRGNGTFNLPAGSWTDDSSLTLALLESIKRLDTIDYKDIMNNFMKWMYDGDFTPFGRSFDIGRSTMQAINRYKLTKKPQKPGAGDERSNGNGGLMRIMPACLYCIDSKLEDGKAIEIIHKTGSLTHGHIRSNIACGLYYFMSYEILNGSGDLKEKLQKGIDRGFGFYEKYLSDHENLEYYTRLRDLDAFARTDEDNIKSSGYVVDTLEAAVWSLLRTDSFEQALLTAVNLGLDTDTVGAVAGGLAGLFYGYESIPADWLEVIQKREWIESML